MAEKILSCFIDESGDFGPYDFRSPYYYVAMVLHDQSEGISEKISVMESRAANNGYPNHAIHTGPLIRQENVYINEQNRRLTFLAVLANSEKTTTKRSCANDFEPQGTLRSAVFYSGKSVVMVYNKLLNFAGATGDPGMLLFSGSLYE